MRQLDGLRAVAILLVMFAHFHVIRGVWGYVGVRLFFVLSGFLITGILLDGTTFRKFYWRRSLRIFPAYYATLLVYALAGAGAVHEAWPYLVTYTQNIYFVTASSWEKIAHFWSLAVEEQFYLLWPIAILGVRRRSVPLVLILFFLSAITYRGYVWAYDGGRELMHWQVFGCMDSFAVGGAVAYARRAGASPHFAWLLLPAWFLAWELSGVGRAVGRETALALCFGGVIWIAAEGFRGPIDWALGNPVSVAIGRISYGLYLLHILFVSFPAPLAFMCSFAAALALRLVVENPFNRLKGSVPAPQSDSLPSYPTATTSPRS